MALRNRELHARNDDDASPNMVDMTHFLLVTGLTLFGHIMRMQLTIA